MLLASAEVEIDGLPGWELSLAAPTGPVGPTAPPGPTGPNGPSSSSGAAVLLQRQDPFSFLFCPSDLGG